MRTERKFCSIRRRGGGPGGVARRVVRGRPREPRLELGEGGEAGAPEAIDRLVVVADDHDVVRPIRRPPEQLDELDLGDVGVLELVDQDVAELALPAAQDVGAGLEQLRDGGDLLAEVERAAARELLLVGSVDGGELGQAQDLEGGAVDDVGRGEGVDARVVVAANRPRPCARPVPATVRRASRSAVFVRGVRRRSRGSRRGPRRARSRGPGVGAADLAERLEVALRREARVGGLEAAVALLEDAPLLGDEGVEVVGRDQLVLGPVDELDEARPAPSPRSGR